MSKYVFEAKNGSGWAWNRGEYVKETEKTYTVKGSRSERRVAKSSHAFVIECDDPDVVEKAYNEAFKANSAAVDEAIAARNKAERDRRIACLVAIGVRES